MLRSPTQIKIGILIVVLVSIYSGIQSLFRWMPRKHYLESKDYVSQFEEKLRPLKSRLAGEVAVGYLGDHSDNTSFVQQSDFQITQYVLAPVMLTDKREARYVVSVKPLDVPLEEEIQKRGLVLQEDFQNEVRLYERRGP